MNIDLVYYFREVNHNYFLNGPEKVNGNIVNNSPSYQLTSANDVVPKINQMIASLAPDITNVGLVTSELYTGDIQVNTYRGELNVSSAPDYTSILTSINTNLTNLNSKFVYSNHSLAQCLESIFLCLNATGVDSTASQKRDSSYIRNGLMYNVSNSYTGGLNSKVFNTLSEIRDLLKLSVSPNSSITDVISSLNSNIHNDLTTINTTSENKDTVLIVDGQQDFVIRKQNNDDYDS